MYKKLTPRAANRLTSGGQIVTVATTSKEGVADIMTAAWNTPYDSDQVLVVLDRSHDDEEHYRDREIRGRDSA